MKRIHIVGPFPPQPHAGAKSFIKLIYPLNEDPAFGVEITTFDPKMSRKEGVDNSLDSYANKFTVNYVRWYGHTLFRPLNRFFGWHTDSYALFARKCRRILQEQTRADLYFLRGQSFSTFLLAPFICNSLNRPVVLFFSDPWLQNPDQAWTPKLKERTKRSENQALSSASGVVFTNAETQDSTLANYPNLKLNSVVIPHTYLSTLYRKANKGKSGTITLTFSGHFYGERQPWNLFQAIADLKRQEHPLLKRFALRLIGPSGPVYRDRIRALNIEDLVHFLGRVDYMKTLAHLQKSDVLVNIDAPRAESLYLPSKLIDYLGCKRPIWSLSASGPAASLVTEYGGIVTPPDDVEAIKRDLSICLEQTRKQSWNLNLPFAEEFESQKMYPLLKGFLNSVLN